MTGRHASLWLGAATVLLVFAQGRWLIAPVVWLAPIALVRFTRRAPTGLAFLGFVVAHTIALELAYLGMVPLPTIAHIGLFTAISLVLSGLFMLDRALARRREGIWTTLVLPAGWAAFDYLTGMFSPNGTWGSIGYGLADQLVVAQVASITGFAGLTFLVAWLGTSLNWILDAREAERSISRGVVVVASGFGGVLLFGITRLLTIQPEPALPAVLLAAPDTFQGEHLNEVWAYTRGVEQSEEKQADAVAQIAAWQDRHVEATRLAITDGARLVAWAEVNAAFTSAEEPRWITRFQALAREHSVWIGLGLAVFRPRTRQPTQNRFVLIGPEGDAVWDYEKSTRVPGSHHEIGDGRLPRADTSEGRWTAAICFDLDFPGLVQQAGRMAADVLIAPSNDWTEARTTHARMAVVRAIEQGFNLVRPTKDGISLVVDPCGRRLAQRDTDQADDKVLHADVPTNGTRTLYASIGDAFSWLCCALVLAGAAFGLRRRESSP